MRKFTKLLSMVSCLILGALVAGCGSDSNDSNDSSSLPTGGDTVSITTDCGVVVGGTLENPASVDTSRVATVKHVVDSNLLIITVGGQDLLVKLQGIAGLSSSNAKDFVTALSAGETVYYVPAKADCTAAVPGGVASVGQLVTASGKSFTEEIITGGVSGEIETSGACGEEQLAACYTALKALVPTTSGKEVSNFLWKPNSESPYNPGGTSILFNPCGRVFVNGEEFPDYGATNGRCITARSARPGCSFGSNVKIEILDAESGLPVTFGGNTSFTIPNGCNRTSFN